MSMFKAEGFPKTLAWSDFTERRGTRKDNRVAYTHTGFRHVSQKVEKNEDYDQYFCVKATAEVTMVKPKSWVLTSKKSADLLKHEQGHFDIVGLAVVQALYEIENEGAETEAKMNHKITAIYTRTGKTIKEIDEAYETDTNNGMNKTKQKEWDDQLAKWKKDGLAWYGS